MALVFRKCAAVVVACLGLAGLSGCGLDPCFEGKLKIELSDAAPLGDCLFEDFPGGTEIGVRSVGNFEPVRDVCDMVALDYTELPEGAVRAGGGTPGVPAPTEGYTIASMEKIEFDKIDCTMYVSADLKVNDRYEDFQTAYSAQGKGGSSAFYVRFIYRGDENCPLMFPSREPSKGLLCANTHPVRVTKL